MAFEGLSEKLQGAFGKLKSKGTLSEKDIDSAMREVKLALLEADVNFKIVKEFVKTVKAKALEEDVLNCLTPSQQVVKIVENELKELMGSSNTKLTFSSTAFTIYLMVGLQGTGKTTTCGKLAKYLIEKNKKPMLCACDVYRPAAIEQLKVIGSKIDVPVFSMDPSIDPVEIAKVAKEDAEKRGCNVLIIDTAGRLQIDDDLMNELNRFKEELDIQETLLVVDALSGQDAVNTADGFNKSVSVDGIIMTKLDGDSRGGAALSTKYITGKPIKFLGTGEKLDALDVFHPDRIAGRILGMGDILSLIEDAESKMDEEKAKDLERRLKKNQFTLSDFLDQMAQIKKLGGLGRVAGMLPGMGNKKMNIDVEQGEKEFAEMEAIILSMTQKERENPSILNGSRRKRISSGCGQPVSKINSLVKKYDNAKKMMKTFSKKGGQRGFPGF